MKRSLAQSLANIATNKFMTVGSSEHSNIRRTHKLRISSVKRENRKPTIKITKKGQNVSKIKQAGRNTSF